ncbi:hypothetical protein [Methylorubrum extorquens]|uniref:hypothetical protein n=1 Tax=Methylorubrum extorquens TaxID=408 RepID=UPI0020A1F18B|nr:hypothetical protein [Methylorubrum extorquens]MCP1538806.1 hypothetical protein [Methylorubrum extorquens]
MASGEAGSIVDRPRSTEPNYAIEFIDRLEAGMKCHHGRVMGRWLDHVWAHRKFVDGLIADFVAAVRPTNAVERRMAQQFGLIDATAQIAVGTRFLPWTATLPRSVVIDFYRSAVAALKVGCPVEALVALREALDDGAVFPNLGAARELIFDERMVGFRFSRNGDEFVAIRQERLSTVLGATTAPAVLIGALEEAGVIEGGHGARRGKQLHVRLISRANRCIVTKPRCLGDEGGRACRLRRGGGPGSSQRRGRHRGGLTIRSYDCIPHGLRSCGGCEHHAFLLPVLRALAAKKPGDADLRPLDLSGQGANKH